MLGEKILSCRKKQGLSQEQLGEKVNVTRQTISNWELNETTPNPEQLKSLSKALDVSIDELLDNERKDVLMNKVSKTEELAGIIIKILKVFGVIFVVYFAFVFIALVALVLYRFKPVGSGSAKVDPIVNGVSMSCVIDELEYQIEFDSDENFECDMCSSEMMKELKKVIDFDDIAESVDRIADYFEDNDGNCK